MFLAQIEFMIKIKFSFRNYNEKNNNNKIIYLITIVTLCTMVYGNDKIYKTLFFSLNTNYDFTLA